MNKKPKAVRTPRDLEKQIWEAVVKKIFDAKSAEEIEQLLHGLITYQEKESIARRLAVLSLIQKGWSYKKIGELLWVSPITISAIKKSITGKEGYRSYHDLRRGAAVTRNKPAEPLKDSAFQEWLDYVAFVVESGTGISGPRWKFLHYNSTMPKKYRRNSNKVK